MTTQFGANATGSYEAPNFVTGKQAPVDDAAANLIGNLTKAGIAAAETYVSHETSKFQDIIEKEIAFEKAADHIGPNDNPREILDAVNTIKEVKGKSDKMQQAFLTTGLSTKKRLALKMDQYMQEKIAEKPWMANAIMRAGADVVKRHEATLDIIDAMQEATLQDMKKGGAEGIKALLKTSERMHAATGLDPAGVLGQYIPFSMMTPEQHYAYQQSASALMETAKKAEEARTRADELRAERMARASERTASAAEMTASNTAYERQIEETDQEGIISNAELISTQIDNKMRTFLVALSSASDEQMPEVMTQLTSFLTEARAAVNQGLVVPYSRYPSANSKASMIVSNLDAFEQMARDPLKLKSLKNQLETHQITPKINFARNSPTIWNMGEVYGWQNIGEALALPMAKETSTLRTEFDKRGIPPLARQDVKLDINDKYFVKGAPIINLSDTEYDQTRQVAWGNVRKIHDPSSQIGGPETSPKVWGYSVEAILHKGVRSEEVVQFATEAFDASFPQRMKDYEASEPNRALQLKQDIQRNAKVFAEPLKNAVQEAAPGSVLATPEGFVIDRTAVPNPSQDLINGVNALNGTYRALMVTGPKSGVTDLDKAEFYMREVFGIPVNWTNQNQGDAGGGSN